MNKVFNIVNDHYKDKFFYYVSFVLIFPFWNARHHKAKIIESTELLTIYREDIIKITRYRQDCVKNLYKRHEKKLKNNWKEIFHKIMDEEINYFNMHSVALEIESLHALIATSHDADNALLQDFNQNLTLSESEININYYAYHALFQKVHFLNRRWPWKQLLKIIDFDQWQIRH